MSQRDFKTESSAGLLALLTEERRLDWVLDRTVDCVVSRDIKDSCGNFPRSILELLGHKELKRLQMACGSFGDVEAHPSSDQLLDGLEFDEHGRTLSEAGQSRAAWRFRVVAGETGPLLLVFRRDPATEIARVVHDLRTPLAAIVTAAERLVGPEAYQVDPAVEAATITKAGRGLLAEIESLLQPWSSHPAPGTGRWDPLAVVTEVVQLLAPTARSKGLDVDLMEFGPVRSRTGDPTPFRRILVNLIGNAVKFSDRGTVVVTVVDSGGSLRVSVRDEGPGIEPGLLPRLFTRGSRGSNGVEGHGLGLANVRDLAVAMGGAVRVESSPGQGSTFTVVLPYAAASQRLDALRILLVDDCEHGRRLLEHRLRSFGAEIHVAEDGFAAESLGCALPFDVLLVDLSMPGRDGAETLGILRRNGVNAPAVALTASTDDLSARRALEAGFSLVLTKPVDPESLRGALADLGRCRAAA